MADNDVPTVPHAAAQDPELARLEPGDVLTACFTAPLLQAIARVELTAEGAFTAVALFARGHALAAWAQRAPLERDGTTLRAGALAVGTAADRRLTLSVSAPGGAAFATEFELARWTPVHRLDDDPDGAAASAGAAGGSPMGLWTLSGGGEGTVAGESAQLEAWGQLSIWRPAQERPLLVRELAAWFESGRSLSLRSARTSSRADHDREHVLAAIASGADREGALAIEDPRLSTTYGSDDAPLRAGLELWPTEDSQYARRASGGTVCAATAVSEPVKIGRRGMHTRVDFALMAWRMDGTDGVGPYLLTRVVRQ
jgi:hypothetical protein